MEIRIDLARVAAKSPLKALADVELHFSEGNVTIRRCAVFEKDGERPWASLPRLQVEKGGKKQFVPIIDLPRELKQRVLNAVLKNYLTEQKTDNPSSLALRSTGAGSVGGT